MKRREFITLLGGTAAWPVAAGAQQAGRMRRIGVLQAINDDAEGRLRSTAFADGLKQLGWSEGGNVSIDYRWAAGDPERIRPYAAELIALQPDVIWSSGALVINLKTAKALGLDVPPTLLATADEVIE